MTVVLAVALGLAAVLIFRPPHGAPGRLRSAGGRRTIAARSPGWLRMLPWFRHAVLYGTKSGTGASMTLVVQQLAALLKGGRTPSRLWDELWAVHGAPRQADQSSGPGAMLSGAAPGLALSDGSVAILASARAAAATGAPVADGIRRALPTAFQRQDREARIWSELAACLDIAEASGCPLADVLTRFAAQLEVEEDADAARQTALAGPKATVSLLTWLPVMGLGLGAALGVDPLGMLLETPLGLAALAAGIMLTVAGRIWSARLVAAAAGAGMP